MPGSRAGDATVVLDPDQQKSGLSAGPICHTYRRFHQIAVAETTFILTFEFHIRIFAGCDQFSKAFRRHGPVSCALGLAKVGRAWAYRSPANHFSANTYDSSPKPEMVPAHTPASRDTLRNASRAWGLVR